MQSQMSLWEAEGKLTQKSKKQCDKRSRDWSDMATSPGMSAVIRRWKEQREMDSPLEPPKGAQPYWHLDLAVYDSVWIPEFYNCKSKKKKIAVLSR